MTSLLPNAPFNLVDFCLSKSREAFPAKIAYTFIDKNDRIDSITYEGLYASILETASHLKQMELPPHSVIIIRGRVSIEWVIGYLSVIAAGYVAVLALDRLPLRELHRMIEDAKAVLILNDDFVTDLPEGVRQISLSATVARIPQGNSSRLDVVTRAQDPALIFYTSGSGGNPKGVLHAQRMILGRAPIRDYWLQVTSEDVVMHSDEPVWSYSNGIALLDPIVVGTTSILCTESHGSAEKQFALIERFSVSLFVSEPLYLIEMAHSPAARTYPHLKRVYSAGYPLPPAVKRELEEILKAPVFETLGMTEMSNFLGTSPEVPAKDGTIGKVQPGRLVSILPLEGGIEPVKKGEIGLLALHENNPGLMLGYVNRPDLSREKFRHPWFIPGDMVKEDEEGYFTHCGRSDEMLNPYKGELVSPQEVESVIRSCPGVEDAVCKLKKDGLGRDAMVAYVVLLPGNIASPEISVKIDAYCRGKLSETKCPDTFFFIDSIPRNQRGKIERHKLA